MPKSKKDYKSDDKNSNKQNQYDIKYALYHLYKTNSVTPELIPISKLKKTLNYHN